VSLRDQLLAIHQAHGKLTPRLVVDAAKPAESPLHPQFEWDNNVCGDKYRLLQAADLIRSVEVRFTDSKGEKRSVREFWAVERREESGYQPLGEIVEDDIATKLLLKQAEREWKDLYERYQHLAGFVDLVKAYVANTAAG